ncbi:hypothetical protein BDB00DRAFT_798057 [Zychaea mexicana]|uniref:uncharacterized protein n=1 Tax=Zychaea mexicana TaxID=64656 RepID=UPI0022FE6108|nr:uncharacterized protein BDB00DRAFT_798057 [Zychaea mexicana]KAI9499041.1 hypothetical protein BDB00DRAFT_798057 [Zychaea mexicana]
MFAKSKRFQEGTKEYIPGPGEYNIPTGDDLGRHKRYGFLNQTNRFNGEGPVEISPDFFAGDNSTASLSSETRFSSVSTSSNKTEDARTRRQMSELATQFEKYRHSMQKEIEALQLKNRKMEATVQSMTLDKETTQSTLLKKDQELASIRQENLSLQKSVSTHYYAQHSYMCVCLLHLMHAYQSSKNQMTYSLFFWAWMGGGGIIKNYIIIIACTIIIIIIAAV